jgi:hypothetical protein
MFNRASIAAAVLAVAAVSLLASVDLAGHDWDVTRFLRVGEVASARGFVSNDIPDTQIVSGWGHDGQANYVLAATLPDLAAAEGHLDSVTYRARRIVYPALVAAVPRGRPLAFALLGVNLAAVAIAAAALSTLARARGASRLVGAVVGVTPAFLASVLIDLGDGLALALLAWGYVAWCRLTPRSRALAVVLFTLAALTRETALVVPAALLLASFLAPGPAQPTIRRDRWLLLVPVLVEAAWLAVLEVWTGGEGGRTAAQVGMPFQGWAEIGFASPEILAALCLVLLSIWVAVKLWPTDDRAWAIVIAAEAALLCCLDRGVLFNMLNLSRITPWVIPWTAIVLLSARPEPVKPANSERRLRNRSESLAAVELDDHRVGHLGGR